MTRLRYSHMSRFFSKCLKDEPSLSNILRNCDFGETVFSTDGQILLCKLDEAKVDHDKRYSITQYYIQIFF